jgi:hypothetical protein
MSLARLAIRSERAVRATVTVTARNARSTSEAYVTGRIG